MHGCGDVPKVYQVTVDYRGVALLAELVNKSTANFQRLITHIEQLPKDKLVADCWTLDENPEIKVWLLNEHEQSLAGAVDMCIIANDPAHIELFYNNFKGVMTHDYPIQSNDIAQFF